MGIDDTRYRNCKTEKNTESDSRTTGKGSSSTAGVEAGTGGIKAKGSHTQSQNQQDTRSTQKETYKCSDADRKWADKETKKSDERQDDSVKENVIKFIKEHGPGTPGGDNTYTDKRGNTFTYDPKTNTVEYTLTDKTMYYGGEPPLSANGPLSPDKSMGRSGTLQFPKDFKQWEDFIKFDSRDHQSKNDSASNNASTNRSFETASVNGINTDKSPEPENDNTESLTLNS